MQAEDEKKTEAGASERSGATLHFHEAERSVEAPASPAPGGPAPAGRVQRRVFTAGEKAKILKELDGLPRGSRGAYLRQVSLYSSLVDRWRRQKEKGLETLRGPKDKLQDVKELERRLHEAEVRNRQLEAKLKRSELVIELQKKYRLPSAKRRRVPKSPHPKADPPGPALRAEIRHRRCGRGDGAELGDPEAAPESGAAKAAAQPGAKTDRCRRRGHSQHPAQ